MVNRASKHWICFQKLFPRLIKRLLCRKIPSDLIWDKPVYVVGQNKFQLSVQLILKENIISGDVGYASKPLVVATNLHTMTFSMKVHNHINEFHDQLWRLTWFNFEMQLHAFASFSICLQKLRLLQLLAARRSMDKIMYLLFCFKDSSLLHLDDCYKIFRLR